MSGRIRIGILVVVFLLPSSRLAAAQRLLFLLDATPWACQWRFMDPASGRSSFYLQTSRCPDHVVLDGVSRETIFTVDGGLYARSWDDPDLIQNLGDFPAVQELWVGWETGWLRRLRRVDVEPQDLFTKQKRTYWKFGGELFLVPAQAAYGKAWVVEELKPAHRWQPIALRVIPPGSSGGSNAIVGLASLRFRHPSSVTWTDLRRASLPQEIRETIVRRARYSEKWARVLHGTAVQLPSLIQWPLSLRQDASMSERELLAPRG